MAEWQPIETAPANEFILVWCVPPYDEEVAPVWVVRKDDDGDFWIEHDADGMWMSASHAVPTHWMPLPEPPK